MGLPGVAGGDVIGDDGSSSCVGEEENDVKSIANSSTDSDGRDDDLN